MQDCLAVFQPGYARLIPFSPFWALSATALRSSASSASAPGKPALSALAAASASSPSEFVDNSIAEASVSVATIRNLITPIGQGMSHNRAVATLALGIIAFLIATARPRPAFVARMGW